MRLTFLCTSSLDYPSPRGRWLPLARELAARGHDVRLVLLHHEYDRLPAVRRRQIADRVMVYYVGQMHVYGPVGRRRYFGPSALVRVSLVGALALARAAIRLGGDAVHVCKPQPINGLAGLLATGALGCRLYVDCDDYEAGGNRFGAVWQRRLVQIWEDRLPQRAGAITVNTRFLQRRYQSLGLPESRVVYVPNGIPAARIAAPDARQVAGLRAGLGLRDLPVVAYVGTLSRTTHNAGLLLEAFAHVVRRAPAARLLLVGDGEDRAALQGQAHALGLAANVRFVGPAPPASIPAYLGTAACSVDPVADDAVARARSPLKIVESLAAGVPVVTGDVGDRAEMLGQGAGVLVAPGDAAALAEGIVSVLNDRERRARLAEGARERAGFYRWDRLAQMWLGVYRE